MVTCQALLKQDFQTVIIEFLLKDIWAFVGVIRTIKYPQMSIFKKSCIFLNSLFYAEIESDFYLPYKIHLCRNIFIPLTELSHRSS